MSDAVIPRAVEEAPAAKTRPVATKKPWLVRYHAEWRQIGIVGVYLSLLFSMYFVEACRNVLFFAAACYFGFLNSVVIHNHLHQGVFHDKRLNRLFRCVLSFGALYPASANIPAHNLVHHQFEDDGQPDWAAPDIVDFRWNLLNLLHFPNVAGTRTFDGVQRWKAVLDRKAFTNQYILEQVVAFGLTIGLLIYDFWPGLFFIVLPQLYGARCILRINLIQHDRCDIDSEWNHSRNFVGRAFNWIMCNNGYHTIHHNKAGLHWSKLADAHDQEVKPRIDPSLDEPSMVLYLLRTYLFQMFRPAPKDVAAAERVAPGLALPTRDERRARAAADAGVTGV
ncbi:MAG: fatty acid desaturase [Polyangiaceae bacterium]